MLWLQKSLNRVLFFQRTGRALVRSSASVYKPLIRLLKRYLAYYVVGLKILLIFLHFVSISIKVGTALLRAKVVQKKLILLSFKFRNNVWNCIMPSKKRFVIASTDNVACHFLVVWTKRMYVSRVKFKSNYIFYSYIY